ncbi:MAG: RNA-binding protein [Alteromonadaceae bacterium]|jgi:RNA-binding protein
MNLSKKQIQHLRGLAHDIKPVVLMGSNGLTEAVIAEIELAIAFHELVKIKVVAEDRDTKTLMIDAIVRETGATKVHTIGNMLVLFKTSPEQKITIPRI